MPYFCSTLTPNSDSGGSVPSTPGQGMSSIFPVPQAGTLATTVPSTRPPTIISPQPASRMDINSITQSTLNNGLAPYMQQVQPYWPEYSSSAPVYDYQTDSSFGGHRNSISSASVPTSPFHPTSTSSPIPTGAIPWARMPPSSTSEMFPSPSQFLPPVCSSSSFIYFGAETDQPSIEPPISVSFSKLDEHEWGVISRDLSAIPGLVRNDDGPRLLNSMRWQDCLDAYWRLFHPLWPIVHKPSFFAAKPAPLLISIMVAIGSAYDTRVDAKLYSLTLLEIATKLVLRRPKVAKKSRLADLQTVFLLEVLGRFRSRRPQSETSGRFRILYSLLNTMRPELSQDPLSFIANRPRSAKSDDISGAYEKWVTQETKRRMLQACLTFDTEQHFLFNQKRALVPHNLPQLNLGNLSSTPLLPCAEDIWESSPIEKWEETASMISKKWAAAEKSEQLAVEQLPIDPFRSRLLISHCLTAENGVEIRKGFTDHLHSILRQPQRLVADFTYHSLVSARLTPLRDLLTIASESWLLGRKVESETDFQTAKLNLRLWVEAGTASIEALWHATQLLRTLIEPSDLPIGERLKLSEFRSTHLLHEEWGIYLSVLIAWAHGAVAFTSFTDRRSSLTAASPRSEAVSHTSTSSTTSNTDPPTLLDPHEADAEMREYLHSTDVPTSQHLRGVHARLLSRTHGLIESIRTRRLSGALGGLMNEAERVLYRLVEGRSRISNF